MASKYYKWNKRGSKIIINSGYKTFDNYIDCISRGNCLSRGQKSFYIRPFMETKCNENNFELGHLRNYDLSMFNEDLDSNVKDYVNEITVNNGCILYEFYTYKNYVKKKVGYIVEQNGNFKIFVSGYYSRDKKRKCLEFIVNILKEELGVI